MRPVTTTRRLLSLSVAVASSLGVLWTPPAVLAASDFTLVVSPGSQQLPPGGAVAYQVEIGSIDGFSDPVSLAVGPLPAGVTPTLSADVVIPPGTATLTLSAAPDAQIGEFDLVVTATSGGLSHVASGTVIVEFGLVPLCYGYLQGTVRDSVTGAPIEGASVYGTTTDAAGRFGPEAVQLGEGNAPATTSVLAWRTGYWDSDILFPTITCGQTTSIDLLMLAWAPATVRGTVVVGSLDPDDPYTVIPDGPPIEGATFSVESFPRPTGAGESATSGADGAFVMELQHLGEDNAPLDVTVTGGLDGYWWRGSATPSPIPVGTVSPGDDTSVEIGLVPMCYGSISGRVVYGDTQAPGVGLQVQASQTWHRETVITDAAGEFSIPAAPLGYNNQPVEYGVSSSADLYFSDHDVASLGGCGSHAVVTLVLAPQSFGAVDGYVTDEDTGEPVAGVWVGVSNCSPCDNSLATTDAAGYYRIDRVPADIVTTWVVSAGHPDYWFTSDSIEVPPGPAVRLDMEILRRRFGFVSGTVRDAVTGEPIAGASVGWPIQATTDDQGAFASGPIGLSDRNAPAVVSVGAGAAGYWSDSENTTVYADQTSIVNLELLRICPGATIRGVVADITTGEPIEGATVVAAGRLDYTDQNGEFTLLDVPVGNNNTPNSVTVFVSATGYHPQNREVLVFCGARFVLDFGPPPPVAGVEGTVVDAVTGDPIAGATMVAEWAAVTTTDGDGHYIFDDVPLQADGSPRAWEVTAITADCGQATEGFTAVADTVARVDFSFCAADGPPELSVVKTPTPDAVAEPGAPVTFEIVVTNHAASTATLTSLHDDRFGNLDGAGTCSLPQALAAGGSYGCSFSGLIEGNAGSLHTNVVTAVAGNDAGTDEASASAGVTVTDVPPSVTLAKSVTPASLPAPGGAFTYSLEIGNTSVESVTITTLGDTDEALATDFGDCADLVGDVLPIGGTVHCSFEVVRTDPGTHANTAIVEVADDDGGSAVASAVASVTVSDSPPTIAVTKTPSPASIAEPGGVVTFTVAVTNSSGVGDPVVIQALIDSAWSDGDGDGHQDAGEIIVIDVADPDDPELLATTCGALVGAPIAPGSSSTCTFSLRVEGNPWADPLDILTVTAVDDEGTGVTATAEARVDITQVHRRSVTLASLSIARAGPATLTGSVRIVNESDPGVEALVTAVATDFEARIGNRVSPVDPTVYGCEFWLDDGDGSLDDGDTSLGDGTATPFVLLDEARVLLRCDRLSGIWEPKLRVTFNAHVSERAKIFSISASL